MSDTVERRLRVNPTLCEAVGYCAEIVPELITLDDWGFPIVNSRVIDTETLLNHARRAIVTCPRVALLLEESVPAARKEGSAN
jgi:ferredoxin